MLFVSQVLSRRLASISVNVYSQLKELNDSKQYRKALEVFDQHTRQRAPTNSAISQVLKACVELGDFQRGTTIHQTLSSASLEDSLIRLNLIRLYMKCSDLRQAREIFDGSKSKLPVMYNVMLNGLVANDRAQEALELFRKIPPPLNEHLFSTVFKICAQLTDAESIQFGQSILKTLPREYQTNVIVLTSALHMLMKRGEIAAGEQLFARIQKNPITCDAMMSGYLTNARPQEAIDIFFQIDKPVPISFMLLFNACARLATTEALSVGREVFSRLSAEVALKNRPNKVLNAALDMFIKCDDVEQAESLFARLKRDVVSYGSMMKLYNQHSKPKKTLLLFEQMQLEKIEPNAIIMVLLLNTCAQLGDLNTSESIVAQVPRAFRTELWVQNALIDMWGKTGEAKKAKKVFETIVKPDGVSFASMINSYGLNGMGIEAVEFLRQVPVNMLDRWIYVCVLNACSHSGLIDEAREIFHTIPAEKKTDKVYSTMVDALSRTYHFDEALRLIDEFEQTHPPYYAMYIALLSGARNQRNARLAQEVFDRVRVNFPDLKDRLASATVLLGNTYALSGDLDTASDLRTALSHSGGKKDAGVSTTVVNGEIATFRAHDRSHPRSPEIYDEMDRLTAELVSHGYKCDASWVMRPLMADESVQSILCGHSERLAIVYNLIQRPSPSRIQLTKNLRMCGDCHAATKLIALIRQIEIIVRDANRIHHFYPNGQCSCQDHF